MWGVGGSIITGTNRWHSPKEKKSYKTQGTQWMRLLRVGTPARKWLWEQLVPVSLKPQEESEVRRGGLGIRMQCPSATLSDRAVTAAGSQSGPGGSLGPSTEVWGDPREGRSKLSKADSWRWPFYLFFRVDNSNTLKVIFSNLSLYKLRTIKSTYFKCMVQRAFAHL